MLDQAKPADYAVEHRIEFFVSMQPPEPTHIAERTCKMSFKAVRSALSDKPLRRPSRSRPERWEGSAVAAVTLEKLAETHSPPKEWFEERVDPFSPD